MHVLVAVQNVLVESVRVVESWESVDRGPARVRWRRVAPTLVVVIVTTVVTRSRPVCQTREKNTIYTSTNLRRKLYISVSVSVFTSGIGN